MRKLSLLPALLLTSLLAAAPLSAAKPEEGHVAIGATAGAAVPFESDYSLGFQLEASLDYYLSSNIALRATGGYLRNVTELAGDPTVTQGYFLGSALYVWDQGSLRPFVQAGLGFHAVEPVEGGRSGRAGVHVGGGAEFLLDRRLAVVGQALVHFVGGVGDRSSTFLGLAAGLRYHF